MTAPSDEAALSVEEPSYLERAQRLLAEHAELFHCRPPRWSPRLVLAPARAPRAAVGSRRKRSPQLTLPLRPQLMPDSPRMRR